MMLLFDVEERIVKSRIVGRANRLNTFSELQVEQTANPRYHPELMKKA